MKSIAQENWLQVQKSAIKSETNKIITKILVCVHKSKHSGDIRNNK